MKLLKLMLLLSIISTKTLFAQVDDSIKKDSLPQKILEIYSNRALPYLAAMTSKPIKRRDEPERELSQDEKVLHEIGQQVRMDTYKLYMEGISKKVLKDNPNQDKALLIKAIEAQYKDAFRLLPDKFYEEVHLEVDKL